MLAETMKLRTKGQWLAALDAARVPCGAINDLGEVFADPQVRERAMTVELPHPLAGAVPLVASPLKLTGTPVQYRRAPPLLGEHTDEVLQEFGLTKERRQSLREQGVI
jgi:crotonobetainyl-CoA:carnitine CoA-transferase CaiB-like acyl-CoA transferase